MVYIYRRKLQMTISLLLQIVGYNKPNVGFKRSVNASVHQLLHTTIYTLLFCAEIVISSHDFNIKLIQY